MPTIRDVKDSVRNFLSSQETAVVATTSPEGVPQAATMYYVIDDDFSFYFLTHLESKKTRNLRDNGHVAIVIGFGPSLKTVQAGGVAEVMEDWRTGTLFRKKILLQMMERIEAELGTWPVMHIQKGAELAVLKMTPTWMTYLNLDKEHDSAHY